MAEKIIKARVWWKTDTLENWEANPLILGPGEPAWVRDGLGNIVDLKVGDGTRRFSELQYVGFGGGAHRGIGVFAGSGAPTTEGQEGDIYLDMDTGAVYSFGTEWADTGYSINASWGNISGDITQQTDLVEYVAENGFGENKVGSNLHLDPEGKVGVGLGPDLIPDTVLLTSSGAWPPQAGDSYLYFGPGASGINAGQGGIALETSLASLQMGEVTQISTSRDIRLLSSGGSRILLEASSGSVNLSSGQSSSNPGTINIAGSYGIVNISSLNGKVRITAGGIVGTENKVIIGTQKSTVRTRVADSTTLIDTPELFRETNSAGAVGPQMFIRQAISDYTNDDVLGARLILKSTSPRQVVFQFFKGADAPATSSVYAEYENGMPATVTDNMLPTVGYVNAQIAALEARIAALENA